MTRSLCSERNADTCGAGGLYGNVARHFVTRIVGFFIGPSAACASLRLQTFEHFLIGGLELRELLFRGDEDDAQHAAVRTLHCDQPIALSDGLTAFLNWRIARQQSREGISARDLNLAGALENLQPGVCLLQVLNQA